VQQGKEGRLVTLRTQLAVFAGIVLTGVLVACSPGTAPAPTPPARQSNAAPAAGPDLSFPEPYRFGDVQQKAPPAEHGEVPVTRRIPTTRPFVYITIDDGAVPDPDAPRLVKQSGARPVLFLNLKYVRGHEDYFRRLIDESGAVIGDHTVDHPNLAGKPYEYQRREICDDADAFQRDFGQRPELFRPPFGAHDPNTLRAAADCGMRVAVLWSATVNNGHVQFQEGDRLRPGDIVLMHFRKTFVEDYTALINQARHDGLTPVPLTDFLGS
jgi:peptidoglycan/xylan/chitin deacetylase (PgdA/CDA1 family)